MMEKLGTATRTRVCRLAILAMNQREPAREVTLSTWP
ncbi:MAG: hypothetical protein RL572_1988, partial [Pseudomonadota bacterium]